MNVGKSYITQALHSCWSALFIKFEFQYFPLLRYFNVKLFAVFFVFSWHIFWEFVPVSSSSSPQSMECNTVYHKLSITRVYVSLTAASVDSALKNCKTRKGGNCCRWSNWMLLLWPRQNGSLIFSKARISRHEKLRLSLKY